MPNAATADLDQSLVPYAPPDAELAREEDIQARIKKLTLEFGQRIVALVSTATITVTDQPSCQSAVNLRATIGQIVKEIEAGFEDAKAYYHGKHKEVCAEENKLLVQLVNAKNTRDPNTIDGKLCLAIQAWNDEEERKRRLEEDRLAEVQRQENHRRAVEEAARCEQEEPELAAAIIEEAIAAPAPVVVLAPAATQISGLKMRRDWKWRPIGNDPARAQALVPREYMCIDEKKVDAYVKAINRGNKSPTSMGKIPGIEIYSEQVPVR